RGMRTHRRARRRARARAGSPRRSPPRPSRPREEGGVLFEMRSQDVEHGELSAEILLEPVDAPRTGVDPLAEKSEPPGEIRALGYDRVRGRVVGGGSDGVSTGVPWTPLETRVTGDDLLGVDSDRKAAGRDRARHAAL